MLAALISGTTDPEILADLAKGRLHPQGLEGLDWALEESALAAVRSKDVYLAAQHQRLRPRRGHKKALGAVKHSIIVACWRMLSTGELYRELGGEFFRERDPERLTKRLVAQLEALGHNVTWSRSRWWPEGYFPVAREHQWIEPRLRPSPASDRGSRDRGAVIEALAERGGGTGCSQAVRPATPERRSFSVSRGESDG